jgi:hypothetical protein
MYSRLCYSVFGNTFTWFNYVQCSPVAQSEALFWIPMSPTESGTFYSFLFCLSKRVCVSCIWTRHQPSLVHCVALLPRTLQEVPLSNFGPDTGYPEILRGFPLALKANAGIISRLRTLPYIPFKLAFLIIPQHELLIASLNTPSMNKVTDIPLLKLNIRSSFIQVLALFVYILKSDWLLNCCWPSPAQEYLVPSPTGLINIFYCLDGSASLPSLFGGASA